MRSRTKMALGILAGIAVAVPLASAHVRDYAATEYRGALLVAFQFSNTCIDSEFTALGQGGLVGGLMNSLGAALDPISPDVGGSCWRKNHIPPNANGDVSFSIMDQAETNVGGCLTQDVNGNGVGCGDDADVTVRFCNQVTVNTNVDPVTGLAAPNHWRFQDGQGVPSRTTQLTITRIRDGSALVSLVLPGPYQDCGPGVDAFGTTGFLGHS